MSDPVPVRIAAMDTSWPLQGETLTDEGWPQHLVDMYDGTHFRIELIVPIEHIKTFHFGDTATLTNEMVEVRVQCSGAVFSYTPQPPERCAGEEGHPGKCQP